MAFLQEVSELLEVPDKVIYLAADTAHMVLEPALTRFDRGLRTVVPATMGYVDGYVEENIHELAKKLPLMKPSHVIFTVVAYFGLVGVLYVVSRVVGRQEMRIAGLLNNLFLFCLSVYMGVGIAVTAAANGFTLWNNPIGTGPGAWRLAKFLWLFYVSKIPEFADTFLMVLKQNYRQLSFLHLYHHSTIYCIWFVVVCEGPGGEAYWSAMVNSFVHVVMYGYYFGTSAFPSGPVRDFLNRIKFFITYGQMTQFACNCLQSVYDLYLCTPSGYPVHLIKFLFIYMVTLLALFGNFLVRNKGKAQKKRKHE